MNGLFTYIYPQNSPNVGIEHLGIIYLTFSSKSPKREPSLREATAFLIAKIVSQN